MSATSRTTTSKQDDPTPVDKASDEPPADQKTQGQEQSTPATDKLREQMEQAPGTIIPDDIIASAASGI